jgi:hypothetical protein
MATKTVPADATPAVSEPAAPSIAALRGELEGALNTALMRIQAALMIMDKGELYDAAAAAQDDQTYALITAVECLLKNAAETAQKALNRAWAAPETGVSHG